MSQSGNNLESPGTLPSDKRGSVPSLPAAPANTGEVPAGDVDNAATPFHPLANIFPMLDDASQRAMARDIADRGQLEPIILFENQILDGRCRYRACLLAAVLPSFEEYRGHDPLGYVVSRNIHRRHLLKDSQRALVAARLATLPIGANQYSEGMPIGTACELLKVKDRSVIRARTILNRGIPELVKAVEEGAFSVSKAHNIAKLPESEQRATMHCADAPTDVAEDRNSPSSPATQSGSDPQTEIVAVRTIGSSKAADGPTDQAHSACAAPNPSLHEKGSSTGATTGESV